MVTDPTAPADGHDDPSRSAAGAGRAGVGDLLRIGLRTIGPHRGALLLLSFVALVAALVETGALYLIGRLAVALAEGATSIPIGIGPLASDDLAPSTVVTTAACFVGALALASVPLGWSAARLSESTIVHLRSRFIHAYLDADWAARTGQREGYLQIMLGEYAQRAERLIQQISSIIASIAGITILFLAALVIAPFSALLAVVGAVLIGATLRPMSRTSKHGSMRYAAADREFASAAAQTERVGREITAFDVGAPVAKELEASFQVSATALRGIRRLQPIVPILYQCGVLAVLVGVMGWMLLSGRQDVTATGPVVLLLVRMVGYAKQLQNSVQNAIEFAPYASALEDEIVRLESQPRRRDGVEATDATPLALQDVSFEYVPGRPVLESLRLTVHRGETVGIIGPSGGGKSTLVQLLLGLRQPTAGRIVAGGVDLAAVRPASWAALTRLVPQDNEVIYGSVADNIRFYRSDATDAAVRSAAERAHLAPQIEALPEGYDTMIGLGAHTLSGGQRQRLGIARALLGDPALLILDEPTSALDPLAERMVLQTLRDIKASTTMILVAHRRSTLAICDRVVRIHEGTLTEVLDREELLDAVGSMPEEPPFPSGDAS